VVDADVRIYVQEVRAVHTVATDGECELPSACPECGARSPRVLLTAPSCLSMSDRIASGRRKVRAHHRTIRRARAAALRAPSWIVQEAETCQAEGVSASLTGTPRRKRPSSIDGRRLARGKRPCNDVAVDVAALPRRIVRSSDRAAGVVILGDTPEGFCKIRFWRDGEVGESYSDFDGIKPEWPFMTASYFIIFLSANWSRRIFQSP